MDLMLIYGFLWLLWLPSYVSQGIASVVLERACEVYQNPGTYLAYQGDEQQYLTCAWNGTDNVDSFTWTLNGLIIDPIVKLNEAKRQRIMIQKLDDTHAGVFTCTIRTVNSVTAKASVTLQLQGRVPEITSDTDEFVAGNNVTLTCKHSIINVTGISWFEDGFSLYQLGRGWVTVHGDAYFAESISVSLRLPADSPSEKYECRVESEIQCKGYGGRKQITKKTQRSELYEIDIKYPIELNVSTSEVDLGLNDDFNISCTQSKGDTPSNISWYKLDDDGTMIPISQVDTVHMVPLGNGGKLISIYKAKPYMAGTYVCKGWNGYGQDSRNVTVNVKDRGSGGNIIKLTEGDPGVNRKLELLCYDDEIDFEENATEWFKDGVLLRAPHDRYDFSDNRILIPTLMRADQGNYYCRYADENHPVKFYSEEYRLKVIDFPPQPINLTIDTNHTTENSLVIQWAYSPDEDTVATAIKIVADFSINTDNNPDSRVQNTIKCEDGKCPTDYKLRGLSPGTKYRIDVISLNDLGESPSKPVFHSTNISQQLTENSPNEYVMKLAVGCTAGVFVLMCALGYIFFRRHKRDYKKKVYDKIEKELGFTIPKTLRNDYISNEYEYKNLKFLDTLGEGAFGKVLKAEAQGLKCPQGSQIVAVKMCREENEYDKNELLAEINILSKLGVHQHVIPLLGVCTRPGRPTCLITQYMPDGDLQNYLRSSRSSFVGTYPFKPQTQDSFQLPNISNISNLCTSDDTLTSKDLISFARQISCGMEYVASQKIVHRDLAARNVLVASKRSLKITDFGLAREMRGVNEEYVMGPNRKVPYRWLAPESFFEKKFTVHSDVWAYGVLLYEILTLGGSPYPRHTIRDIPEMLKQGYRMSPPTNSKPELNQLMSLCWHEAPESRPSFTEIKNLLDELLGDRPEEYLDCGDPEADILPNLNSNDNKEMDQNFRYSFMSTATMQGGDMISSIAAQGYDRIADAHSAYGTMVPTKDRNESKFSPRLNEIKSNPIPDTYQHLPIHEPSPDSARKNSAQYVNHDLGMEPVIVKQDFMCGTENFVAQKL
ncbi:fibroblast growth factor receptor 2-like isoform X3 [Bolinopsis microptera]|uniref:fibroblast growth factor receptor 2-like isoform X3 n=1 Tax=Bolinopsis microptera TaxID=2820187 RepID=UPI0030791C1A